MAFTTNTASFGSGDIATEQAQLTRQQQLAQALAQQAQAPLQAQPTPAGGLAVPISKGEIWGKIGQALASAYVTKATADKEKDFNQSKQAKIADALGKYDEMRAGKAAQPVDIFGTTPDQPTQGTMPAIPANPRGAALGLIGSGVPELQQFGMQSFLKDNTNKFGTTPQYDQNGNAFLLSETGEIKPLPGISARNDLINVDGQLVDKHTGKKLGDPIQKRANPATDLLIQDENGNWIANTQLADLKKSISKAGATNVQVKTDVKTGESLASQVGPMMKESTLAAEAAVKQAQAADHILGALSGPAYTGPGANVRLKGAQIADTLGVGGKDTTEKIANTRTALQNLSQLTLQGRQQMRGQGAITEGESALAQRAVSGDIDLTANEIKQLANAAKRAAAFQYQEHQRKLQVMQNNPNLSGIAPFYQGPAMQDSAPVPQPVQAPQAPAKRLVYDPATGSFR